MSFHASARYAGTSALNEAVIQKRRISGGCRIKECPGNRIHQSSRSRWIERRSIIWIEHGRLEVICILLFFVVRAEQTQTQPNVQGQPRRDVIVVLNVWFYKLVPTVIFGFQIYLRKG